MKRTDLAYIAGLFDGEGNIAIVKRKKKEGRTVPIYHLVVRVGMCDEYLPRWLKMAFGGYISFYKRPNSKHRDLYTWSIGYNNAIDFLMAILPFLKLKKPQVELAIEFQGDKKNGGGQRGKRGNAFKTEGQLAVEEAEYILMKSLKH